MTILKDVMSRYFDTVPPDASMKEALAQLDGLNLSMLLVCRDRRVVGALMDPESRLRLRESGRDPEVARVRDYMTTEIMSGREDQEVKALVASMRQRSVHMIPVLDGESRLLGVFSLGGPWRRKKSARA